LIQPELCQYTCYMIEYIAWRVFRDCLNNPYARANRPTIRHSSATDRAQRSRAWPANGPEVCAQRPRSLRPSPRAAPARERDRRGERPRPPGGRGGRPPARRQTGGGRGRRAPPAGGGWAPAPTRTTDRPAWTARPSARV